MKKRILVVVDMQNDFIDGALGSPEAQAIIPAVINKIKEYDNEIDSIFYTKDTHFENTYLDSLEGKILPVKHCIADTDGHKLNAEISNALITARDATGVLKYTFGSESLLSLLDTKMFLSEAHHGKTDFEIELCGLCTDICVVSNALLIRAKFPNLPIIVDASCCAGVTPEKHKAALETMKSCQINVINE